MENILDGKPIEYWNEDYELMEVDFEEIKLHIDDLAALIYKEYKRKYCNMAIRFGFDKNNRGENRILMDDILDNRIPIITAGDKDGNHFMSMYYKDYMSILTERGFAKYFIYQYIKSVYKNDFKSFCYLDYKEYDFWYGGTI